MSRVSACYSLRWKHFRSNWVYEHAYKREIVFIYMCDCVNIHTKSVITTCNRYNINKARTTYHTGFCSSSFNRSTHLWRAFFEFCLSFSVYQSRINLCQPDLVQKKLLTGVSVGFLKVFSYLVFCFSMWLFAILFSKTHTVLLLHYTKKT